MDNLLTIKQAAEFLHVSEMSLRRWTNAGKLKCYRVGKKKERRFRMEDLLDYLEGTVDEIPLGFDDFRAPKAAHIVHFYSNETESLDLGARFVKQGLDRGELVLVMTPEDRRARLLQAVEDLGVLTSVFLEQGVLTVLGGKEDPHAQAGLVDEFLSKAGSMNGFRLLGDMVWTKVHNWSLDQIYTLEQLTNRQRVDQNALFFCQYDTGSFSADGAFMAMQAHDHTLYNSKFSPSPYFEMAKEWVPNDH